MCERRRAIDTGRYIISDRWVVSYQMGFIKIDGTTAAAAAAAAAADCVPLPASSSILCLSLYLSLFLCFYVSDPPSLAFSVSCCLFESCLLRLSLYSSPLRIRLSLPVSFHCISVCLSVFISVYLYVSFFLFHLSLRLCHIPHTSNIIICLSYFRFLFSL